MGGNFCLGTFRVVNVGSDLPVDSVVAVVRGAVTCDEIDGWVALCGVGMCHHCSVSGSCSSLVRSPLVFQEWGLLRRLLGGLSPYLNGANFSCCGDRAAVCSVPWESCIVEWHR